MATKFNGIVNLDVRDSVPDWTPFREAPAPEGAPNVLLVLYDDTGMAAWSPYGGRINMPTMQKLADPVSKEYGAPFALTGGRIRVVEINIGDDVYLDLERDFQAGMARD